MTPSPDLLRLKLTEALSLPSPRLTRRDVHLPRIPGKALAIVGVRRGGKTSFMRQLREDRIQDGRPRESQLFIFLEDERLSGMGVADLNWMLEEHARQFPVVRTSGTLTLYLDEVQTVSGWEGLVRRLMDTGNVEVFVSGSSARLLSREVATSLRGRGMEVRLQPFSFREALRHQGLESLGGSAIQPPAERAVLDERLRSFLEVGGFPEAQGADPGDRLALLGGYVDSMVLRDVIDRYRVSHPVALRWLQAQLLSTPGGTFSINKCYETLRSQGISVGKDTLHAYLGYLEDSFLIRTVAIHSASERVRMANPRKAYPVDTGLITLYERTGRRHAGRGLETAVLLELERRGWHTSYVRTPEGWEVDFLAEQPGECPLLVQVCLGAESEETWEREVRSLASTAASIPEALPLLITLDSTPPGRPLPTGIEWMPAAAWLLLHPQ